MHEIFREKSTFYGLCKKTKNHVKKLILASNFVFLSRLHKNLVFLKRLYEHVGWGDVGVTFSFGIFLALLNSKYV
jgi:hypothetical protein